MLLESGKSTVLAVILVTIGGATERYLEDDLENLHELIENLYSIN